MLLLLWNGVYDGLGPSPKAAYLFTMASQNGAVYQFVAEGSPLDAEYVAGESPSRAEYTHQVPGRIIP